MFKFERMATLTTPPRFVTRGLLLIAVVSLLVLSMIVPLALVAFLCLPTLMLGWACHWAVPAYMSFSRWVILMAVVIGLLLLASALSTLVIFLAYMTGAMLGVEWTRDESDRDDG